ncbi:hypothetical protein KKD52_18780 [Myxococcota bacterium]|nr:hypothetical protein [Myxococcota bacterium]
MSSHRRLSTPRMLVLALLTVVFGALPAPARAMEFPAGSLIIPMDVNYQNYGMLQAYGLVYRLIDHGVPVYWIFAWNKTMRPGCDPADGCPWDCTDPVDGGPCLFRTLTPDFWTTAVVVYDDAGLRTAGDPVPLHGYRGAPFVIHADDAAAARAVIDAWNNPALFPDAPWAQRSVFSVVSVHDAPVPFDAPLLSSALILEFVPLPAILADGREAEFAAVLRAAGIPQSDGTEFSDAPCEPGTCGPGTARPDLLPPALLSPERGNCLAGQPADTFTPLLDSVGRPRYSHLAMAGFTMAQRESVICRAGPCAPGDGGPWCYDSPLDFHGHRALLQLKAFQAAGGWLFALGEAVYALENAAKNSGWPQFDYAAPGRFVVGSPAYITCPCFEPDTVCVTSGCLNDWSGVYFDCCMPADPVLRTVGLVPVPAAEVTFGETGSLDRFWQQFDGDLFAPLGPLGLLGLVEPDQRDTLLQDSRSWIASEGGGHLNLGFGASMVYLADVRLDTALPITAHAPTNLARLYLNTLFLANRPTVVDTVNPTVVLSPFWADCPEPQSPFRTRFHFSLESPILTTADEIRLELSLPSGVVFHTCEPEATLDGHRVIWPLTGREGSWDLNCTFTLPGEGIFRFPFDFFTSHLSTLGTSSRLSNAFDLEVSGTLDQDGDGLPACTPCEDYAFAWCGDDPAYDDYGPWDEGCDEGPYDNPTDRKGPFGCVCTAGARPGHTAPAPSLLWLLPLALGIFVRRRG